MTQEQYDSFMKLVSPGTEQEFGTVFHIYKDVMFKMIMNHDVTEATAVPEKEARLVLQMMFSKLANLERIVQGIEFNSSTGDVLKRVIDPILISASIRGLFEAVGMFNIIYVAPQTDEARYIMHTLWVLAGLNYRQKFVSVTQSEEFIAKSKQEREHIIELIAKIEATELYRGLTPGDKEKIQRAINGKHYNIKFVDGVVKGLGGFQELINNAGIHELKMGQMYTYYSLSSHPSNVSVFQFGAMFSDDNTDTFDNVKFNLSNAFMLVSVFIVDYFKAFPALLPTFKELSDMEQALIQHNNVFLRGQAYAIE